MKNNTGKKTNIKTVTAAAAILAAVCFVLFLISLLRDMFWTDTNEAVLINIPEGVGTAQIAALLEQENIIDYPTAFRIYEKLSGGQVMRSGVHKFFKGMSYGDILNALSKKSENAVTVTIPEGYEMRRIAELLEENEVCTADEFYKAAEGEFTEYPYISEINRAQNRLEGYLFPDTYEFEKGQSARSVIGVMLKAFDDKVYSVYKNSKTDKSLDEIVIMASIVEREAANDEERGKIASVFYNRLAKGMKLQSCATVQYIIKERKKILSNSDIKIDSPYNTYMYKGLPVGPIASPGVNSVLAALNPEKTDYYYFAAAADGSRNVFSKTGEEHMQTVKELQK